MNPKIVAKISVMFALSAFCAQAQSTFLFRNYYPPLLDVAVYDAQGLVLMGPNYSAELWGSTTPSLLTPLVVLDQGFRREILPFNDDGHVMSITGFLGVPSAPPGGYAWLQMRAWDARLGGTYEDVAALGIGGYGESPLFYALGGNPTAVPPESPAPLYGLQSFSLRPVVPEPSAVALLSLGAASLWWAARRK